MRQVTTMIKAESKNCVTRIQQRLVDTHVGVSPRVRLHIGMFCAK